jgi:putative hydrolase of the HAD superfamily
MSNTERVLVFDADDTLWENNVRFERVIDDFLTWLAHPTLDRAAMRHILNDIERANTTTHGYGARVFLGTLHDCFERLQSRPANEDERAKITNLVDALLHHEVELMPEVSATLEQLGNRYRLALLTKGQPDEQQGKLDASGLAHHFSSVNIVREKDVATYRRLTAELALDPTATWMIGNSPKSDILPARAAGWNAVFIPYANTWVLEEAELDPDDAGVMRLRAFPELLDHF